MNLTAQQIMDIAPAGSTVTLQLDGQGNLIAWYIRQPNMQKRSLFR